MRTNAKWGGKLEFDVEPVQWSVYAEIRCGADENHGTITPIGVLENIWLTRTESLGVEGARCSFSKPIFDGKCDIITEINRIDSMSTTVEWTRDIDKTWFFCPPSAVRAFLTKPFHMTVYPKK